MAVICVLFRSRPVCYGNTPIRRYPSSALRSVYRHGAQPTAAGRHHTRTLRQGWGDPGRVRVGLQGTHGEYCLFEELRVLFFRTRSLLK